MNVMLTATPPDPAAPPAPWQPGSAQDRRAKSRLQRRLLLGSLPLVLLVLLLAAKLLSVAIASAQLEQAFVKGDAAGVHSAAGVLKVVNIIEPYKAWFNDGDGYVLSGDFEAAKTEFEQALKLAPPAESCQVRVNLTLTLEKLGDAQGAAGRSETARSLYDQGVKITEAAPPGCFQKDSAGNRQGEGQQLLDAKGRLQQKSQQSGQGQAKQIPGASGQLPPEEAKRDQLNQQNKDSQQERNDGARLRDGAGNPLPFDPDAKQW